MDYRKLSLSVVSTVLAIRFRSQQLQEQAKREVERAKRLALHAKTLKRAISSRQSASTHI